jgi:predicted unusual protein kinase regulating ubiquinone biosynthesis (AarF/ABC1/UbiB family)
VKITTTASKLLPWQRAKSPLIRQSIIFAVATKLLLLLGWDKLLGNDAAGQHHRRAKWLVNKLVQLGPTFIKIGQALSTRPDLIPIEYIQELSQLQDRVPPFNSEEAIAVVEAELGKPLYVLYRDFDPFPLASASLGQVHKARLHTGEDVVVKVQRPGLEGLFNLDFEVLHRLVRFTYRYIPNSRKYNLEAIYQEFFELLFQEIDYVHEGKNADRFRENFRTYSQVIVPKVYWHYTTKRVLTLEYAPGIKIDDRQALELNKINPDDIIQLGICCYLKQLLQDGFFQSDPHPGNMAVSYEGKLIFYDFGTMAEVKSIAKDQMIKTFFAVLKKDTEEVVETLVYMGLIEPMSDMTPVKRLVSFLLEKFRDKPIDLKEFEQLGSELYVMFEQQPFRLPPQMTFIIKSLTTLDGIARALDPQYNLLAASQPFVRSITISGDKGSLLGTLARQAKDFIQYKLQQPSKAELAIKRLESRIELGELQFRVRSFESDRALKKIYLVLKSLLYTGLMGVSLIVAVLLIENYLNWAIVAFCFTGFWFIFLLRSLLSLAIQDRLDKLASK